MTASPMPFHCWKKTRPRIPMTRTYSTPSPSAAIGWRSGRRPRALYAAFSIFGRITRTRAFCWEWLMRRWAGWMKPNPRCAPLFAPARACRSSIAAITPRWPPCSKGRGISAALSRNMKPSCANFPTTPAHSTMPSGFARSFRAIQGSHHRASIRAGNDPGRALLLLALVGDGGFGSKFAVVPELDLIARAHHCAANAAQHFRVDRQEKLLRRRKTDETVVGGGLDRIEGEQRG